MSNEEFKPTFTKLKLINLRKKTKKAEIMFDFSPKMFENMSEKSPKTMKRLIDQELTKQKITPKICICMHSFITSLKFRYPKKRI